MRGQNVMLNADLAGPYGVTTKGLDKQVRHISARFAEDFVFQPPPEVEALNQSEIPTGSLNHYNLRFAPYAVTEHGTVLGMGRSKPRRS